MRAPADPRVRAAFAAVDRRRFLTRAQGRRAQVDRPIPIGWGQTNSQPSTVADMLDLLAVAPGHRVLDVGTGSGWTTGLLAHLVGAAGRVVGVELVPELAAWGAGHLEALGMPWATIEAADPAVLGKPADGPYDRILVSAGAEAVPTTLIDQLVVGGRLVVPVSGEMLVVDRTDAGPTATRHGRYSFVPLIVPR
ncbi:MAG TPA: protein-L-isoaspartate O-methyltransferase [Acidimicrobiales bacterium]|jgi:protein-L-isoaspartate(D-aspartate) O-methyltransferase|nr:protein-L-isoaspartate O-methyltransferase [Acidimicrobiales bacterium]